MLAKRIALVLLLVSALLTQSWAQTAPSRPAPPGSSVPQASAQPGDEFTQLRNDLNRLESLNLNMSAEIEFLRDQNLQILLRTNSQMWTVVIQDMRRQLEREEQRRGMPPQPASHNPAKPDSR